jgi:hypothetical protein
VTCPLIVNCDFLGVFSPTAHFVVAPVEPLITFRLTDKDGNWKTLSAKPFCRLDNALKVSRQKNVWRIRVVFPTEAAAYDVPFVHGQKPYCWPTEDFLNLSSSVGAARIEAAFPEQEPMHFSMAFITQHF